MTTRSPWFHPATWLAVAIIGAAAAAMIAAPLATGAPPGRTVRVGFLVNLTHAQALVGLSDGTFARALAPDAVIRARPFQAGPLAVEALLAGELDLLYVGPAPAINAYVRTRGDALRVLAGAMSGGSALVVRPGAGIERPADLDGRRVASPAIGSSQDVALRHLLSEHGLRPAERGGTVSVLPLAPADTVLLFRRGAIDAAWLPEPWASRLVVEAGGRLLLDERDLWPGGRFATVLLAGSPAFLRDHPDLARRWLLGHEELTDRLRRDPESSLRAAAGELRRLTGKALPDDVLRQAWARLKPTTDPMPESVAEMGARAHRLRYLGPRPLDLSGLFAEGLLAAR